MTKILIVDYGMANLRSVQKAFEKVGHAAEITSDPNRLPEADKLVPPEPSVYFTHSYYVVPKAATLIATETDYPTPFTSSVWHENVFATQFHPEKSQRVGLQMLKNFTEL